MALYYKSNNNWTEFAPNPYPIGTYVLQSKPISPGSLVGGTWKYHSLNVDSSTIVNNFPDIFLSYNFTINGNVVSGTINIQKDSEYTTDSKKAILEGLPKPVSDDTSVGRLSMYSGWNSASGSVELTIDTDGILYTAYHSTFASPWSRITATSVDISYTTEEEVFTIEGIDHIYERIA